MNIDEIKAAVADLEKHIDYTHYSAIEDMMHEKDIMTQMVFYRRVAFMLLDKYQQERTVTGLFKKACEEQAEKIEAALSDITDLKKKTGALELYSMVNTEVVK